MTEPQTKQTDPQNEQSMPWHQPGFDPQAFIAGLEFDDDLAELDPDDLQLPAPGEKIAAPRALTMRMDWQTDQRIAQIAQARGMSVADYLEELAEVELARRDALELQERRRHPDPHAA